MSDSDTPLRENAVVDITTDVCSEDTNLLLHYESIPKNERSHEDYESLVEMVRMLWSNKLFLEH